MSHNKVKNITIRFDPGPLGGRFRVSCEDGTGAKLTALRAIKGKENMLERRGVKIGMEMLRINDTKEVYNMKFKDILVLLRSLARVVRVINFGYRPDDISSSQKNTKNLEKETPKTTTTTTTTTTTQKNDIVPEAKSLELTSSFNTEHVHSYIISTSSRSWTCNICKTVDASVRYQCEGGYCMWNVCDSCFKKQEQASSPTVTTAPEPLTIQVPTSKHTNMPESDDLDEFESFLDSTCRSMASLESEVGSALTEEELHRANEIDTHLNELMEDL